MTGKQRAKLRSMANLIQPVVYIGKEGITGSLLQEADNALKAREIVKGTIGRGCAVTAKEAAGALADALGAEPIQAIGRKFVLYRRNEKDPVIEL